tara:strand:+ start:67 stop:477 length:411 start_codon:yes stop_codon:yes gene_type:complete
MGRILAIDYGGKRTGLAITDPLHIIATGLDTVQTKDIYKYLLVYCEKEHVEAFVIGDSKHLDNTKTEISLEIDIFAKKLKSLFPKVPIHWIDERFTSKMAKQSMLQSGMTKKKRRQKELVDEISATIILQSFMNSK